MQPGQNPTDCVTTDSVRRAIRVLFSLSDVGSETRPPFGIFDSEVELLLIYLLAGEEELRLIHKMFHGKAEVLEQIL